MLQMVAPVMPYHTLANHRDNAEEHNPQLTVPEVLPNALTALPHIRAPIPMDKFA